MPGTHRQKKTKIMLRKNTVNVFKCPMVADDVCVVPDDNAVAAVISRFLEFPSGSKATRPLEGELGFDTTEPLTAVVVKVVVDLRNLLLKPTKFLKLGCKELLGTVVWVTLLPKRVGVPVGRRFLRQVSKHTHSR